MSDLVVSMHQKYPVYLSMVALVPHITNHEVVTKDDLNIGRKGPGRPRKGEETGGSHRRYVEVPKELDAQLLELAKKEGISIQAFLRHAIAGWVRHLRDKYPVYLYLLLGPYLGWDL